MTHSVLGIILIQILISCQVGSIQSAPLSSYLVSSFTPPYSDFNLPFNHIAISSITGDIYIGARERLYQLDSDLNLKETVNTGKCSSPNEDRVNDNKLLISVVTPQNNTLVSFGGCGGNCQTRNLANISVFLGYVVNTEGVLAPEDLPTVGVLAHVGKRNGSFNFFIGASGGPSDNSFISKLNLEYLQSQQHVPKNRLSDESAMFKHLISYNDYLYYFLSRYEKSYLGRICRDSPDVDYASYTEIELQCGHGGSQNVIQSAYIGPAGSQLAESMNINTTDDLLYAVFSSTPSSSLCVYKMIDVQQRFEDAILGCILGTDTGTENMFIEGSECRKYTATPPDWYQCRGIFPDGYVLYRYVSATNPLSASHIIIIHDVISTSVVTTIERHHTMAFIGDTEGSLHKINIVNSSFGYVYEDVSLGGGSVLQEMFLDESKEQLTLATSSDRNSTQNRVVTIDIVSCGQYQTCEECIGEDGGNDGDPYCGWCTLEARCTRYEECHSSDESTRWLSYNAIQCVSISDVQPDHRLPYQITEQEIIITVQQLPTLKANHQYRCAFDSYVVSAVTTSDTVVCTTPPVDELPTIPEEDDHKNLILSIVSTETIVYFVSTDLILFDCTHHKSCSSCVSSPWPCDWCVYDNMCTHVSSSCQDGETVVIGENNPIGSGDKGQMYCPQLIGTSETFFIPVNINSSFSLVARNIPTDKTKIQAFDCILLIDGDETRVETAFVNESYVMCGAKEYMYADDILQNNVSVSVQWNYQHYIDDPNDAYVTLYKCSANGGSCSRCLSPEATPSFLNCGWCGNDCNVIESDVCRSNPFFNQNETNLCSAPVITDFYPISGPINGSTRLEIIGTDLGVAFIDILEVTVGELMCSLTDMDSYYQPGQSVSCLTGVSPAVTSGHIAIKIWSGSETRTGNSIERFHYRDPMISGFSPTEGQAAGGTRVTIAGMYLNTGRIIEARFGAAQCNELKFENSTMTCITSGITNTEETSAKLIMSFDEVERMFEDYSFTYKVNPVIMNIGTHKSILSGGIDIKVTGERFDLIQEPRVLVTSLTTNATRSEECNGTDTLLICPTPSFPDDVIPNRRRRAVNDTIEANLAFDFDGYIIDGGLIEYYSDPLYYSFGGSDRIYESGNSRLEIEGMNLNLASTEDDVTVLIGPDDVCDVDDLETDVLRCQLPEKKPQPGNINGTVEPGPTQGLPAVTVFHGNLVFYPGYVDYSTTTINVGLIVGIVLGVAVFVIIVLVVVGVILYRRSHQNISKQVREIEMLEKKIQGRVQTAFHELQTDMSEVEEQIGHLGVPFANALDYLKNMLFAGLAILPPTTDPEYLNSDLETAMIMFSRHLSNPDFLTNYIKHIEEQRKTQRRDRVNIASLITTVLITEGKFGYFTETLFKLLEECIEEGAESGRAKSLFRRNETIVEKLLSNWIAICMYRYLKRHAAEPLYLLYQSIKIQVEKGPIDITTGQSVFSLNFECLLEEEVEFNELTLSVVGRDKIHLYYVKVLDVDCMTQVKQKILDAAYRNSHIVQQNRAHEMDLLWYHPGGEERVLKDQDEFNKLVENSKGACYINTIKTYAVPDSSRVALITKSSTNDARVYEPVTPGVQLFQQYVEETGTDDIPSRDYVRVRTMDASGQRLIHLVPENQVPTDSSSKYKTKLDREFLAPRLLVTKKTIQPRLDGFLTCVFIKPAETRRTIKHLFDFFDKMADKYCDEKQEEIAEAWKSSSLPLHYWMTTLTHPSYVFDMRQSRSADQSVSVLANMLDNACKKIRSENTKDSALNRVLFYKDLPGYIATIGDYYESIKGLTQPTAEELQEEFQTIANDFSGLFSRVATLKKLYDFTANDAGSLLDSVTEKMPNEG
ncbi:plexin-A4-like [Lytechinus pictus]|uniref:plexin-A4-like n=1 Tax=Lytechinus pictus TaxID=7653 RepID=UPI0030BA209F